MKRWLLPMLACAMVQAGAVEAADAPPGAAACSGCHAVSASVETAVPRIAGGKPAEFTAAMRDFRSGTRPATVMGRIAKGFTESEVDTMAAWFAAQPK